MALIDQRLQPLFAVLSEAGYDWIVTEILAAIRQGHARLATENELQYVRKKIDRQDDTGESLEEELDAPEPILGDEQIDLAIKLVTGRFLNVNAMLDETRKNLRYMSGNLAVGPNIAFQIDGETRSVALGDMFELSQQIARLNASLKAWSDSVRTPTGDAQ
jgi:hypothetical protein